MKIEIKRQYLESIHLSQKGYICINGTAIYEDGSDIEQATFLLTVEDVRRIMELVTSNQEAILRDWNEGVDVDLEGGGE